MRNDRPQFAGWSAESDDSFDRARSQLAIPFQTVVLALDNAVNNQELVISGDFMYCDSGSTGIVSIELNTQHDAQPAQLTFEAGFAIKAPFTRIRLSWAAQTGKTVKLVFSTGNEVMPNGVISVINSIVNPVNINNSLSASVQNIKTAINPGVGTTVTPLILPPANPNGMTLRGHRGQVAAGAGGLVDHYLIAAAVAPANNNSQANEYIAYFLENMTVTAVNFDKGELALKFPAGWGLWMLDVVTASAAAITTFTGIEIN
ncbi:MAG TPA: hypothetical protein VIE69_06980 [Methylophilaceae bacterium]|jgi:hypothetical protein